MSLFPESNETGLTISTTSTFTPDEVDIESDVVNSKFCSLFLSVSFPERSLIVLDIFTGLIALEKTMSVQFRNNVNIKVSLYFDDSIFTLNN
jgi:hypothetical protein